MAKLYFRFGAMGSGKSSLLMQVAYNYNERGMDVLIIKPKVDTKSGNSVSSRIGIERKADILIGKDESFKSYYDDFKDKSCILVDEVQFLNKSQIEELWKATKKLDVPIICYGLKTDFRGNLFEGSKRLIELSDQIEEIATICKCGKKARFNARYVNGKFTLNGDEVVIDGAKNDVEYISLCGKCYLDECEKLEKVDEEC